MSYTIVGVIGHIDHGKTSLVGALTGVDTDTHPEEKQRGITIDLGFASFSHDGFQFALIDAPGHQKYIGNLLAGVSAVDIGLLVVACDQGIQQQTLEHAAILQTLGVRKLIAAISRIDLADESARLELTEELEVFLADYGFSEVPTIPLSSVTGEGIADLKAQLCRYARSADRSTHSFFRMPIDRVFSVPGRGCVVAGTLWSGSVQLGDALEVAGSDKTARVRELEVHGENVEQSSAGFRTAMNLTGVSASELARGDELLAAGTNLPTSRMVVEVNLFRDVNELKCPTTVQFHTATTSCSARISGVRRISSGEPSVVVVDTERPVIANFAQQFLLRSPYPVGSFGGGRVLAPIFPELGPRRRLVEFGSDLRGGDAAERLRAWTHHLGELDVDPVRFELHLGIPRDTCAEVVEAVVDGGDVSMPLPGHLVSATAVARVSQSILKRLTRQAEETDDAWSVEESLIEKLRLGGSAEMVRQVIDELVKDKQIVRLNKMVAIASEETLLSKKQRARMDQIIQFFAGERSPPTLKEVAQKLDSKMDAIASLVRFATQQRILIDVGGGFLISSETFTELCCELASLFDEQPERSVAEIRDRWQVTRKHAIPFLEYCDQVGATTRQGNARVAGPNLEKLLSEYSVG